MYVRASCEELLWLSSRQVSYSCTRRQKLMVYILDRFKIYSWIKYIPKCHEQQYPNLELTREQSLHQRIHLLSHMKLFLENSMTKIGRLIRFWCIVSFPVTVIIIIVAAIIIIRIIIIWLSYIHVIDSTELNITEQIILCNPFYVVSFWFTLLPNKMYKNNIIDWYWIWEINSLINELQEFHGW